MVDRIVNSLEGDKGLYFGINTGVGAFSNKRIPLEEMKEYQVNLIRSHATGIGEFLPLNTSRRILALRINTLAKGYSGMSVNTMRGLIDFYNSGCVPQIPQCGTVGASGDLVPLAHIGLNLIGEGEIWDP